MSRNPWASEPHRFAVEELLDPYCPVVRSPNGQTPMPAKLVGASQDGTKRKHGQPSRVHVAWRAPRKGKHISYDSSPTGISNINIHEGYPGVAPDPGARTRMCRGGTTTAENYRPTRPSGREAARLVFVVARYRCSRRNAKGRRNTDRRTSFSRAARGRHQRIAMAVCPQTVDRMTTARMVLVLATAFLIASGYGAGGCARPTAGCDAKSPEDHGCIIRLAQQQMCS